MKHAVAGLALAIALMPDAASPQNGGSDEYTRYELLEPGSAKFRILYDVTASTPGGTFFFNPIRKGSEASDESVIDLMTGKPLAFAVVSGAQAREAGLANADADGSYIKVALARPVPAGGGEGRIRILKTYRDPKSYYADGGTIVFARPLGIRRNAVVMPAGFEVVSCNVPVQVIEERDGRIAVSFLNTFPGAADLIVKARRLRTGPGSRVQGSGSAASRGLQVADVGSTRPETTGPGTRGPGTGTLNPGPATPDPDIEVPERARQTREIVYFLQQPETHAFRLYHDYTETREGADKYVNIVRKGSTVSNPSAKILDTGEVLRTVTLRGEALAKAAGTAGEPIDPDTEGVVIAFPPVQKGRSVRLRIEETYTDPGRYGVAGDQLVWHRAFGRPANAVLLPEGWYLTTSSVPGTISEEEGKTRIDFINPRNDEIDVYVRARRR